MGDSCRLRRFAGSPGWMSSGDTVPEGVRPGHSNIRFGRRVTTFAGGCVEGKTKSVLPWCGRSVLSVCVCACVRGGATGRPSRSEVDTGGPECRGVSRRSSSVPPPGVETFGEPFVGLCTICRSWGIYGFLALVPGNRTGVVRHSLLRPLPRGRPFTPPHPTPNPLGWSRVYTRPSLRVDEGPVR